MYDTIEAIAATQRANSAARNCPLPAGWFFPASTLNSIHSLYTTLSGMQQKRPFIQTCINQILPYR